MKTGTRDTTRRVRLTYGEGGFTLLEMMVVIAILAIMSAIAVVAAPAIMDRSLQSACRKEHVTVKSAIGAARASANPADTYVDWLADEDTPQFFVNNGTPQAPSWAVTAKHPGGPCPTTL